MKVIKKAHYITLAIICTLLISFKFYVYYHHLKFIPKGLGVWWVTYSKEESWGFGPGRNEAGAIAYILPENSAKRIEQEGIAYLITLKSKVMPNNNWQTSPLNYEWVTKKTNLEYVGGENKSGIAVYLFNMGFRIDSDIEKEINTAITEPGNFYTKGRAGIVIIAPKMRRVFYVYSK